MLELEFGWVLIYVSAFGFSDYVVRTCQLQGRLYLLYYAVIGIVGGAWLWRFHDNDHVSAAAPEEPQARR